MKPGGISSFDTVSAVVVRPRPTYRDERQRIAQIPPTSEWYFLLCEALSYSLPLFFPFFLFAGAFFGAGASLFFSGGVVTV